jgi:hypothetical protein
MKQKPISLASLVEDFSLYPRHRVDESHVSDLVRALQAGHALPPIIADHASKRIVDGVHRRRAHLRCFGEEATAIVEFRSYADDAALFMDAVELNSTHGRKLDRHDQTRIVLRLRELNVPDQQIAIRLHVPDATITQLAIRVVMAESGQTLPSKRGLEHMRGTTLTDEQVSVMGSVRSAEAGRLCLELTRLLDANMVDLEDQQIRERLSVLDKAITLALSAVAA